MPLLHQTLSCHLQSPGCSSACSGIPLIGMPPWYAQYSPLSFSLLLFFSLLPPPSHLHPLLGVIVCSGIPMIGITSTSAEWHSFVSFRCFDITGYFFVQILVVIKSFLLFSCVLVSHWLDDLIIELFGTICWSCCLNKLLSGSYIS